MTFEKIANIIAERRGIEASSVTMETTFEQLGFDSLDTVEMIMAFEEEFGLTIEANEELKTVADMVNLVDNLLTEKK